MRARVVVAVLCMLGCGGLIASLSAAQAPPAPAPLPTVVVTLGPGNAVSVAGAEALAAGPTRIELRTRSSRPVSGSVVALRSGETLASLRAAVRRATRGPTPLKRFATFEAGGTATRAAAYVTTIDLKPGTTYVAGNTNARNPADFRFAAFTVGATASGAVRPQPDAVVGVYDYAFGMPNTLPREGTIRFENRGERLHIGVAFPLRPGANRAAAIRAAINNQEERLGRLVIERQITDPLGIVSGGTTNDVEMRFPRAGNYLMVCFLEDGEPGNPSHNTIGMVTPFRVR